MKLPDVPYIYADDRQHTVALFASLPQHSEIGELVIISLDLA